MERQYTVEMTITVDDEELFSGQTVDNLVLDNLEEAPFQVDTIIVKDERMFSSEMEEI